MWFKNIQIYRLMPGFKLTQDDLEAALQKKPIRACSRLERHTFGWISPLGVGYPELVRAVNGCMMIANAKREKILPASVVREHAAEEILAQEQQEGRHLSKREQRSIVDDITLQLLPNALSRTTVTYAYLDLEHGYLLVNTSSQKRADDLIIMLRDAVGHLPVVLPQIDTSISYSLTQWLLNDTCPTDFTIDDFCELQAPEKERATIKCQHRDVTTDSIRRHIEEGMQVVQLGMTWNDRISFVIDQNFSIKRIKFLELIQADLEQEELESEIDKFDVDFQISVGEFANFIPALAVAFGGFSDILTTNKSEAMD